MNQSTKIKRLDEGSGNAPAFPFIGQDSPSSLFTLVEDREISQYLNIYYRTFSEVPIFLKFYWLKSSPVLFKEWVEVILPKYYVN